jgi:hypothetical protein
MKSIFPSGSLTSTLLRSLLIFGIGSQIASAAVFSYRYFRFTPTKLKGAVELVQLSEFEFFNGATPVPTAGILVTDPGDTRTPELPPNVVDGNFATKWLDYTFESSSLTFDFGTAKAVDSYNYVTGNDTPDRDPVSWTIEGSSDGTSWALLDTITDFAPTTARSQLATTTNFVLPANPAPVITEFDFFDFNQLNIVPNGTTDLDLFLIYSGAATAKVTNDFNNTSIPVPVDVPNTDVLVSPPNSRDTVYTFTATSSKGQSSSKNFIIRSVQPQTQSYRYVRYTPVKVRGGPPNTTIQLSNFSFSFGSVPLTGITATNAGGASPAGQDITKLVDVESGTPTKWLSTNLNPVIFDLGAQVSFDHYSFSTGDDHPERDPVQWLLEGSNDKTTWTLIDNVTAFDATTTTLRSTSSADLPIPGTTSPPAAILSSSSSFITTGEAVTLTYSSAGASSIAITPGVTTSGLSGTVSVSPATTTTYTLTATSAGGKTATQSVTVTVQVPLGSINYPNFESSSDLTLIGNAKVLNDHATFSNGPDAKRLRLTDISSLNQNGSAWSYSKMKVRDGFETTFDANLAFPVYVNGADGIAFTIQNNSAKYNATPYSNLELKDSSVSIVLDSFADLAGETQANLEVYTGTTLTKMYNLDSAGLKVALGYKGNYLVTNPTVAPYHVKIDYVPGSLSVYVDDILVVNQLAVNLGTANAVDSDGKAWVGFSAKTHNIVAYHDIVNWSLTTGVPSATNPLAITSTAFTFGASPQVILTFSSNSGTKYKATQSADLATWTQVGSTVTALGPSTSITVPFVAGSKGFFRIEQTN